MVYLVFEVVFSHRAIWFVSISGVKCQLRASTSVDLKTRQSIRVCSSA